MERPTESSGEAATSVMTVEPVTETSVPDQEIIPDLRRQRILQGLDLANTAGLEIGPLCWPLVRKHEAAITYVDHTDTETLRRKYAADGGGAIDQIVEVDAIWGANRLRDAVGADRRYGYIVASHVVEHVPDLIGWLQELTEVLDEHGEIRLAVPDKRFTFDHLRRETRLAEVLAAHAAGARVPQPQQVVDFVTEFSALDAGEAWAGRRIAEAPIANAETCATWMQMAREAASGTYHDVHCWVFTPFSFARLLGQLTEAGLVDCECSLFHDTPPNAYEFLVGLRPCADRARSTASWQRMAMQAVQDAPSPGLQQPAIPQDLRLQEAEHRIKCLETELSLAQQESDALRQSTCWRMTAPLRSIASRLRQPRHAA